MKKAVVIILLAAAFLLVMAGIVGVVIFGFFTMPPGFDRALFRASAEESKSLNVKGPVTLRIRDDAGEVTVVSGSTNNKVSVKVVKTGVAYSQSAAERDLQNIKYEITQSGDTISLIYKRENLNIENQADTVDFIVTVPKETAVNVDANYGEVNIKDTTGRVDITNEFGDVILLNIEGGLTADTQSGNIEASAVHAGEEPIKLTSGFGTVTLTGANGADITLKSSSGVLDMSDVRASGQVHMTTEFGDIRFTNGSASSLTLKTNSGKITLDRLTLQGAMSADSEFGEISLTQVKAASYDLQANSGSITVDGASGKVRAHSGFGTLTIKNAQSVTLDLDTQSGSVDFAGSLGKGPHSVHTDFGDIRLVLPNDSALNVDLKTDFGSIKSDIPITVVLAGEVEKNQETGTMNEGGAQLTVETQSGSISIQANNKP